MTSPGATPSSPLFILPATPSPVQTRRAAESVLSLLISTLSIPAYHAKFTSTLPLARIALLLLGDKPTPFVAQHILRLLAVSIKESSGWIRKFELVGGWTVLRTVLPGAWSDEVREAAVGVLLGRADEYLKGAGSRNSHADAGGELVVVCPAIVPAMLSALQSGLKVAASRSHDSDGTHLVFVLSVDVASYRKRSTRRRKLGKLY